MAELRAPADKVRTLAAVKPALVRLLEWQIDQELERSSHRLRDNDQRVAGTTIEEDGVGGAVRHADMLQ